MRKLGEVGGRVVYSGSVRWGEGTGGTYAGVQRKQAADKEAHVNKTLGWIVDRVTS